MAYRLISVKCPECGQTLSIEENRTQAFCSYCGARILISNENEYVFRRVDEAGIRNAETERMVRMREMDLVENNSMFRKILFIVWVAVSVFMIVMAVVLMSSRDKEGELNIIGGVFFLIYACLPVVFGGGYLIFGWLPEKDREKVLAKQGGIRFPENLAPFPGKKYTAVAGSLRAAGFLNVSCVSLHDLNCVTAMISNEKVDKITVNGKDITSGGKMYLPDVPILITYHGK